MIKIEDLQVHPHPLKFEPDKHGIYIAMVAKSLNLTYVCVWGMLGGNYENNQSSASAESKQVSSVFLPVSL